VALAGGGLIIFLILAAVFAPVINRFLGHPPNEYHQDKIDPNIGGIPPLGTWGGISKDFLLGVQPVTGPDVVSQIIYGARRSLLVAFIAPLLAVVMGVVVGVVAGYFGGWVDSLLSRFMDLILAFPLILFAIALISVLPPTYTFRVSVIIFIIGGGFWCDIDPAVRGRTRALRGRGGVVGARRLRARARSLL